MKQECRLLLWALFFLPASIGLFAQPANDDCANATPITPQNWNTSCNFNTTASTLQATASATPPSCAGISANDDIWFSFTSTASSVIIRFAEASLIPSGNTGLALALYQSACPAGSPAEYCNGNFGFNNGSVIINGLTIGQNYYLRCWSPGNGNAMQFKLCVQNLPPTPANDECTGATNLAVQPFGQSCTNSLNISTLGATPSATPAGSCGGDSNNDDVWVKFTATSAQHIFRYANLTQLLGGPNNLGMTIYDGGPAASATCPATTTNVFCTGGFGFYNGYQLIDGFTPGNTYFVRIWTGGDQNFASFDFCIQETPAPPPNDDCANATALTVQPFGQSCTQSVVLNTAGATASATPAGSCSGDANNDDVWVKFTATSAQHIFRFANLTQLLGGPNVLGLTIYDGGPAASATCPATPTNIFCTGGYGFFNGYQLAGGFIPGNTYFVRIWTAGAQNFASFDFCIQETPPPPPNDECANAILITLESSAKNCSKAITVNTSGATPSANRPSCQASNSTEKDTWYKFTATSSKIRLLYSNLQQLLGSPNTIGFAFYKGSCPPNSTAMICTQGFGFFNGKTILEGFEPGATYYFRTWATGSENFASYELCLQAIIPPPNDECANAAPLAVNPGFCKTSVVTNLFDATTSPGYNSPASCRPGSRTEDVWYTAIVPATGNLVIQTSPANAGTDDLVMVAYTGNCGSLSALLCDDNGNPEPYPATNHPRFDLKGRTPGEKITFRVVAANEESMGVFSICATDTTASVLPGIAPDGDCSLADTLLISESAANGYLWNPVFDSQGRIIAEYYPNSSEEDTLVTRLMVNQSGQVRKLNNKYYADRNIHLAGTASPLKGRLRLYLKSTEVAALRGADSTVSGINNMVAGSDSVSCSPAISHRVKTYTSVPFAYGANHYLQLSSPGKGLYYMESGCGTHITWTGNKNTDWHDPANWDCGGVPWIYTNAIIPAGRPNLPVISRPVEVKSIKLESNAAVTVQPGINVKVNGAPLQQ